MEVKMNGIIRVFPKRFKEYTPVDDYVFIGPPPGLFVPEHKEIHVSCTFTWQRKYCEELAFQWEGITNKPVKIGGPAYESELRDFVQGMYLRKNITFTTRGCNNNCPWCAVPKREGKLKELEIKPGNIIQDNNFLQASHAHKEKVFEMLKKQSGICFKGGLEADLIDAHFVDGIRDLKIKELWLACDTDGALPGFKKAVEKLKSAGYKQRQIKAYVLIRDDSEKSEQRLREIYDSGATPFAMLYRDFSDVKTKYSKDCEAFARMWQRPAATIAHMEKGTDYHNFST